MANQRADALADFAATQFSHLLPSKKDFLLLLSFRFKALERHSLDKQAVTFLKGRRIIRKEVYYFLLLII
jgi:hypothetical protein